MPDTREFVKLESSGTLTTGTKDRWQAPFDGTFVDTSAVVGTAPTGATLILDVLLDTVSIYASGKPTIAISGTEVNNVAPPAPSTTVPQVRFTKGQTFALAINQVGSTVAGADLDVTLQVIPA